MVHRPPDSRLLTNLLLQDKEYSKQLYALLDAASASASSLSAYAAASAPPTSHIILKVSGSLASADDAFRRYASSVDEWREQLKGLKTLEDEVTNILRDREILVTRVIKASRQKQSSGSILDLHRSSPSSSSLSTKSEFSTKSAVVGSSKLAHAQSELQACETHLAAKERELTIKRCTIVKTGLDVRFRAMIDCGWAWGEIGKEALATLEQLTTLIDEQMKSPALTPTVTASVMNIQPSRPSSDLSSIAPSQSASQIHVSVPVHNSIMGILHSVTFEPVPVGQPLLPTPGLERPEETGPEEPVYMTMDIPPAHAINEVDLPMAVSNNPLPSPPPSNGSHDMAPMQSASSISVKSLPISQAEHVTSENYGAEELSYGMKRHVLSRRITEEDYDEQHHNVYSPIPYQRNESSSDGGHQNENLTVVDNPRFAKGKKNGVQHREERSSKQERRGSLFGSLRGLFGHHSKSGKADQRENRHGSLAGLFGGKKNKWDTRTDRNLRRMDKNDSEDHVARLNSPPRSGGARLRRASDVTGSRVSLRFVEGNIVMGDEVKGPDSDGGHGRGRTERGKRTGPESTLTKKRSSSVPPVSPAAAGPSKYAEERAPAVPEPRRTPMSSTSSSVQLVSRPPRPAGGLSRNSSIASAASAPVMPRTVGTNKSTATSRGQLPRRASVGGKKEGGAGERMAGHVRSSSHPVGLSEGRKGRDGMRHFTSTIDATATTSLMSIVENVARANRDAAKKLREKEHTPMTNLLPFDQRVAEENGLALASSSTLTVRPGIANGGSIHSVSPLGSTTTGGAAEPKIFIPKAPQSISRMDLEVLEREGELQAKLRSNAQADEDIGSVSVSKVQPLAPTPEKQKPGARQVTALGTSPASEGTKSSPSRRPAQSPLRSALRNSSSRSASPVRAPGGPSNNIGHAVENGLVHVVADKTSKSTIPDVLDNLSGKKEQKRRGNNESNKDPSWDNDDTASVSSYETGHEVLIEGDKAESGSGPAGKNSVNSILKDSTSHAVDAVNEDAGITSPPESVISGTPTGTPQRKKSVRVSLQPTFSPPPPAIYDDENDEERNGIVPSRNVRTGKQLDSGNGVRVNGWTDRQRQEETVRDMWENSSDEDEEYANAKKLLSRMTLSVTDSKKTW
ncbi:hypothetical protein AX15_001491 [Amanita polypyramis BW_CC]|nr:hypothetical protein AX15_001491 [Amanita polypyramis BW_CC]